MISFRRRLFGRLFFLLAVVGLALAAGGCGGPKRVMGPSDGAVVPLPGIDSGPDFPVLLRVGLTAGAPTLSLIADGPTLLLDSEGKRLIRFGAGARIHLSPDRKRIEWRGGGERGTARSPLRLRPVDPQHTVTWREDPFPGEMLVVSDGRGLTLIDLVGLETYLRGVVPWEIGRPGPEALSALAAQAVAARTYCVSHLGEREEFGFDVWSDTRDQVYRGLRGTDPLCDRAVAMTSGLVLLYQGREIEAYYCSTCGGRTSNVSEVWPRPQRPYLVSHSDGDRDKAYCAKSQHFRWRTEWTAAELQQVLKRSLPEFLDWVEASPIRTRWAGRCFVARGGGDGRNPGALRDLKVEQRTTSGRVARLRIETDAGTYFVRGDRTRWVMAPASGRFSILRSADFDLEMERGADGSPRRILASGRGFGHGVGLCQTGALEMARRGHDFREILAHYYPGAELASTHR